MDCDGENCGKLDRRVTGDEEILGLEERGDESWGE